MIITVVCHSREVKGKDDATMASITCSDCGETIDPVKDLSFCPACGSGNRLFEVQDHGVITGREQLQLKKKRRGEKKPFEEIKTGDDLFHKTGQWNRITQVVDRDDDRYFKHIEDADGNVIRHTDKRLSEHQGHGSAKHANPKNRAKQQGDS